MEQLYRVARLHSLRTLHGGMAAYLQPYSEPLVVVLVIQE